MSTRIGNFMEYDFFLAMVSIRGVINNKFLFLKRNDVSDEKMITDEYCSMSSALFFMSPIAFDGRVCGK